MGVSPWVSINCVASASPSKIETNAEESKNIKALPVYIEANTYRQKPERA